MISFCFRSDENGNFLFSAFSIARSGNNTYVDDLRILTSIELYLNSEFYVKHPSFVKVLNSHSGVFNNVDTLFALSVWHGPLDSRKAKMELVKEEALNICGIFAVHLNGQAIYVCLLYLQFVCALFIAVIKVMMPC